ncbi:MAG: hypothetical protein PHE51_03305, partial [Eubacteriales bacterium]|nr:hypothetical protein [Eubacteriales bacterium]
MKKRILSMMLTLTIIATIISIPITAEAFNYDYTTLNSITFNGNYVTACDMSINMYGFAPGTGDGSGSKDIYISLWS